jgi:putative endonuclease
VGTSRIGPEDPRAGLGRLGEEAALRRYVRDGYREVARNWRCRIGEIDLVVGRPRELVFCEVKTRRGGAALGSPFEAVTPLKQQRVRRLAETFLASWPHRVEQVRFDVASVTLDPRGRPHVHVFEDAF